MKNIETKPSAFGDFYVVPMPVGCDVVIICAWKYGLQPVGLCLPHQVYVDKVRSLMKDFPCSEVWLIPACSGEYIKLPAPSPIEERGDTDGAEERTDA